MSSQTTARVDRLAGSGHDSGGGGLALPSLFTTILDALQDHGGRTVADLVGPVEIVIPKRERLTQIYGLGDPWGDLTRDALAQLEYERIVNHDAQGNWHLGEKFDAGTPLTVVRFGKREKPITVTVYDAAERKRRAAEEGVRLEIRSLAADLRPDGVGLRVLDPVWVEALAESMRQWGWWEGRPAVVDQHGRVLDGRHRQAAARLAGVDEPPPKRIAVASDEEAVGYALLANQHRAWTKTEQKTLDGRLAAAGLTVATFGKQLGTRAKQELIAQRLRDDPSQSNREIGRGLGVSDHTVASIRKDLERTAQIAQFTRSGGRGVTKGSQASASAGTQPQSKPRESVVTPELTADIRQQLRTSGRVNRAATAARHGVGEHAVQIETVRVQEQIRLEKQREEEEGLARQAKPPPARTQPTTAATPSNAPAPPGLTEVPPAVVTGGVEPVGHVCVCATCGRRME